MANRDTSRVSGNTRRGILYISRRKHFENYILFQHAHRICMIIVLILSISAILNSQNWSVVRIVSSHTVPNFWPCLRHAIYKHWHGAFIFIFCLLIYSNIHKLI